MADLKSWKSTNQTMILPGKNENKGFTIIEAVVATSVFAMAITAIAGSFLAVVRADQKSRAVRLVTENGRFITEFLTREVRNGSIDYPAYGGIAGSDNPVGQTSELNLINSQGEFERIFASNSSCTAGAVAETAGVLCLTKIGVATTDLTSAGLTISNLHFYVYPRTDPFTAGGPDRQPRVTFTFRLATTASAGLGETVSADLQSTVSSREYPAL